MKTSSILFRLIGHFIVKGKKSLAPGFTLIELLVVIVVTGILGSIAIFNLSSQVSKARRVEAVINVNSCQKSQKAYYAENSTFAATWDVLGLPVETQRFIYKTEIFGFDPSEGETTAIACCMAAEKAANGQMVFACVAAN